jgi:[ribosomal protein S5]-alanine N-acetyltransferase
MHLEFKRLSDISISDIIAVNTNPLVLRQMPLSGDDWEESEWIEWVEGKERQWKEHGYGPWAFVIDGKFAGWGGLQYENGDADLGLVLHPDFWGTGRIIFNEIIHRAFGEMAFESIIILFPPTRTRIKGILRLGFQPDGEVELYGEKFIRYRLFSPK